MSKEQPGIPHTSFVHRYKDSHSAKRKRFRRLLKEGKVRMIHRSRDGWMYQRIEQNVTPHHPQ
jgi:hypothetical protein